MYDTPGLLHPYIMTMRLSREEQKMVEIRKELQPRTFRVKVGQTVHVGGLMRLDLIEASVETIYVTVCASPYASLHMGKTENADDLRNKHFGVRLQPPIGQERVAELGEWKERDKAFREQLGSELCGYCSFRSRMVFVGPKGRRPFEAMDLRRHRSYAERAASS
uniref:Uncharacterized protein n=1 Tax=Ananas comosus var. bracteatus TaxID=296719 RepID=A0A6V7QIA7_ANACO|nr:unnamed protein product [Ananas comosus var. bracteatus]